MSTARKLIGFFSAICALLLLEGCATTAPVMSKTTAKPAEAIKHIEIVFKENELRAPGLVDGQKRPAGLEALGYYELSTLISERAPKVFAANGLAAQVVVIPSPESQESATPLKLPPQTLPRLRLSIEGGEFRSQGMAGRYFLTLFATLHDTPKDGKPVDLWYGGFQLALGADQAVGIMRNHRVDAPFVDDMLKTILETLANEGMIALPGGKAVLPAPEKLASSGGASMEIHS